MNLIVPESISDFKIVSMASPVQRGSSMRMSTPGSTTRRSEVGSLVVDDLLQGMHEVRRSMYFFREGEAKEP